MGYRLNRLDEPVFMAVSKPLLTEFGIHHRLESCVGYFLYGCNSDKNTKKSSVFAELLLVSFA